MIGRHIAVFFLLVVASIGLDDADADVPSFLQPDEVIICPAAAADSAPPQFTEPACKTASRQDIDPQNNFIWVKGKITLDQTSGAKGEPLSIYVLGKMSSAFYLNGEPIGTNGVPGPDAESEIAGRMDAVFYPPQSLFRMGDNDIVFKASSHQGLLTLKNPVHMISISTTRNITHTILHRYWPSLLTLGLFLVGAVYFAITGLNGTSRQRAFSYVAICAFAAAQLLAEVSRGLFAYEYPIHDLRLLAITIFSSGFGLSVAFHVFSTFDNRRRGTATAGLAALSLIALIVLPGFDIKALAAIIIPLAGALIAAGIWAIKQRPRALRYFGSLFVFLAAIALFPSIFLDVLFFYLIAAFLLFLFVEQGLVLVNESKQRRHEQARADRLELALDQAKERGQATIISIKSAGKMERVPTDEIIHCQGASGYCEINIRGGREILHSVSLTEMEKTLPATFLRVHRSHLVNTAFVEALIRDPAGTGLLKLTDGSEIPVSRRVMPAVRQALA